MISLNLVPVHQWTHRHFDGLDPWANNQPVRWSVVVYSLTSQTFASITPAAKQRVPAESVDIPRKYSVGIFAEAHNRYRVLPLALQDLWRAREVRDEDLPWLLHRIEQPLRRNDYPPNRVALIMLVYAIMFGLFALAGFATYAWLAPRSKHVRQFTDVSQWSQQPLQADRSTNVHGDLRIVRLFQLRTPVTLPAGIRAEQNGDARSVLAIVQAAGEKRLVLATQKYDLTNASGVVLRTDKARLPGAALSGLKKSYPDVNTDYVFCTGWDWPDAISPYDAEAYTAALYIGAGTGMISLLSASIYTWWRRRRQRQADTWRNLLRARAAGIAA